MAFSTPAGWDRRGWAAGWDRRGWAAGFVLGNLFGSLLFFVLAPSTQQNIDSVFGRGVGVTVAIIVFLVSTLALPGTLSGLGRRRFLWWGLLPALIIDVWMVGRMTHRSGPAMTSNDFWGMQAVVGAAWLISSGPVSLVRWQMRRKREKREAAQAALTAYQAAATVPQEGVWPPPPQRGE